MSEKLERNVYRLGFVSLFTDLSSQMIYPLVPAFLESLGATKLLIGLIEGIAEGTASFVRMIAGALSDRLRKRRLFVFLGYSLSTVVKPFLFFANHWVVVLAVRFLDRVGKGIRTPSRDALISDSVAPSRKGYGFGFHRGMDRLGAAFGPLLALLVLHLTDGNLRLVFLLSVVPAALAVSIIGRVREIAPAGKVTGRLREQHKSLGSRFAFFVLVIVVFTLGNSSNAFLILKAREVGLSISAIPLIWLTYNLVCSISSPLLGRLSDRIGRTPIMFSSFLVYCAIYAGFGFAFSVQAVWLLFACYGVYYGLSEGIFRAYIADLVEPDKRATAYGFFNTAVGITLVPASLIFGALWDGFSSRVAFLVSAALALAAALLFLSVVARPSRGREG